MRSVLKETILHKNGIYVIPAGSIPDNPTELLSSERMRALMKLVQDQFDYIILDSSPMAFFTDTKILCNQADASILVVRQDMIPDRAINDAIDSLRHCKARFLGYVFNDVHSLNLAARIFSGHRDGYGYGYGYGRGYGYGAYRGDSDNYGYGASGADRGRTEPSQDHVTLSTARKRNPEKGEN